LFTIFVKGVSQFDRRTFIPESDPIYTSLQNKLKAYYKTGIKKIIKIDYNEGFELLSPRSNLKIVNKEAQDLINNRIEKERKKDKEYSPSNKDLTGSEFHNKLQNDWDTDIKKLNKLLEKGRAYSEEIKKYYNSNYYVYGKHGQQEDVRGSEACTNLTKLEANYKNYLEHGITDYDISKFQSIVDDLKTETKLLQFYFDKTDKTNFEKTKKNISLEQRTKTNSVGG